MFCRSDARSLSSNVCVELEVTDSAAPEKIYFNTEPYPPLNAGESKAEDGHFCRSAGGEALKRWEG